MSFVDWGFHALMLAGIAGLFLTRFQAAWPYVAFIVATVAQFADDVLGQSYGWAALWALFLGWHVWNFHRFLGERRKAASQ